MIATSQLPSLSQLYNFIQRIDSYPVSVARVLDLAESSKTPHEILDFYKSFPADETFDDQDDLTARSEQVQILTTEQAEQPWEQLAPQE